MTKKRAESVTKSIRIPGSILKKLEEIKSENGEKISLSRFIRDAFIFYKDNLEIIKVLPYSEDIGESKRISLNKKLYEMIMILSEQKLIPCDELIKMAIRAYLSEIASPNKKVV